MISCAETRVSIKPDVPSDLSTVFDRMHDASRREVNPPLAVRKDRLRRLLELLDSRGEAFAEAICEDFGHRSTHETCLAEALVVEVAVKHALRHLGGWMRPKRVVTEWHFQVGRSRLLAQPLGVVGIIAPWNYPLQLTLSPAAGAIAAGNRVLIKPSELAPRFSALLKDAVATHFDPAEMGVVEGGQAVSQAFAASPFDHLLLTGSARVGRMVAEAAARNLTPVTLELGGKSPAIIDRSADLAKSARRIAFGKLLNAGQTCIAPDYVLCPHGAERQFTEKFFAAARSLYGSDPRNPDYTAIINEAHYGRLQRLVADAEAKGGHVAKRVEHRSAWESLRKFPPCIVLSTSTEMLVRREEIFGPILPVVTYDSPDEAITLVNAADRPLALYWFGTDARIRERILRETVSGGVTVNDCLLHVAQENLPFGGVGASGIGAYHGEWGFRTFSKTKPVFHRGGVSGAGLLQPPYGRRFDRIVNALRRFM
jgi:coniferyl-aldehyde dehydrogenase